MFVNNKRDLIFLKRVVGAFVLCVMATLYSIPTVHAQSCNEITSLPVTIDEPGVWCVTRDLSWQNPSAPAIHIVSDNVQLDLMGHTVSGQFLRCEARRYLPQDSASSLRIGVKLGERNQPVKNARLFNGTIKGFAIGMFINGQNFFMRDLDLLRNARIGMIAVGYGTIHNNSVRATGGVRCGSPSYGMYLVETEGGNGFSVTRNNISNTWSEYIATGLYSSGRITAVENTVINSTRIGMQILTTFRPSVLLRNRIGNTGQYYSNQGAESRRGQKALDMFIPRDFRAGTYIGYRGNEAFGFDEGFTVGFTGEYRDWGGNTAR